MSDNVREAVDWNSIAADAARFGRGGASIVAKRAREREAELLAALAAPSSESPAATGSGAAPTRDAVAEVLLREANRDLTGWTWAQLCESRIAGIVAAVALARRQADAVMARWPGASTGPRDEAVVPLAWAVVRANGTRDYVYQQEASAAASVARLNAETDEGFIVANQPYRVVALVPQHEEP